MRVDKNSSWKSLGLALALLACLPGAAQAAFQSPSRVGAIGRGDMWASNIASAGRLTAIAHSFGNDFPYDQGVRVELRSVAGWTSETLATSNPRGLLQVPTVAVGADGTVAVAYPADHALPGDPALEHLALRVRRADGTWTAEQVAPGGINFFLPRQLTATATGFTAMWGLANGSVGIASFTTATDSWTLPVSTGPAPTGIVAALLASDGRVAVITERIRKDQHLASQVTSESLQVRSAAGVWSPPSRLVKVGFQFPLINQSLAFSGGRFAVLGCSNLTGDRCRSLRLQVLDGARLRRPVTIRPPRGLHLDGLTDRVTVGAGAHGRFLVAFSAGRTQKPNWNSRQLRIVTIAPRASAAAAASLLGRFAIARSIAVTDGGNGRAVVAVSALRFGCANRYVAAAERRNGHWSSLRQLACERRQPYGWDVQVASTEKGFLAAWSHLGRSAAGKRQSWLAVATAVHR